MIKATERTGELTIFIVLFCIGMVGILMSLAMPKGEYSVPGPGFFPALLGSVLCLVSLVSALVLFRRKLKGKEVRIGNSYIWATVAAVVVVAVLFERIGFIFTMTLFVGFLLKVLSPLGWLGSAVCAVCASVAAYLFFEVLLGVQLPRTPWV